MKRKLRSEKLENRLLLATDFIFGANNAGVTGGFTQVQQLGALVSILGTDQASFVSVDPVVQQNNRFVRPLASNGPGAQLVPDFSSAVTQVTVSENVVFSTSFENLAGIPVDPNNRPASDVGGGGASFVVGDVANNAFATITGRAGTRGVPPAYNNGAFALGIGENVNITFSQPADRVSFAVREIVEATPDVVGQVILNGQQASVVIQATPNGANPPQSGDWDVIDSANYPQIGKVTSVNLITQNGITNIDDLNFTFNNQTTVTNVQGASFVRADLLGGNDFYVSNINASDIVFGGLGSDILFGGLGNDILSGGPGADVLIGGAGRDLIDSDALDLVFGGAF